MEPLLSAVLERAATPRERRDLLIGYLFVKAREGDWHAVWDAAIDLQVLDSKYPDARLPR